MMGKQKKIVVQNKQYKSMYSNATKSVDFFLEMDDGKLGAAVLYVIKNAKIYILLKIYDVVNQKFHLNEIVATENYAIYNFDKIKHKLLYLQFGSIEVVSVEPNFYERWPVNSKLFEKKFFYGYIIHSISQCNATKSIDFFLETDDGTLGAAVIYVMKIIWFSKHKFLRAINKQFPIKKIKQKLKLFYLIKNREKKEMSSKW